MRGERDLLHALTRCWASLWTPRAVAYRERHDVDPATVAMAVVVQLLVPARAAGVLFTANPLTGSRDELVINASWGLGDSVVSGQVNPDTVIVDQRTGRVSHRTTSAKTVRTVPVDGGVREEAIDDHLVHAPVLTEQDITRLADLGRRVDALHDHPSDVEWALDDSGTPHLLQARPITGLPAPPLPATDQHTTPARPPSSAPPEDTTTRTPAEGRPPATSPPRPRRHRGSGTTATRREEWNDSRLGDYLWTNGNLGEAIPSVMTPATWSFVQVFMLRTMGIPSCQGHPTWGNIGGRFYLNLSTSLSLGTAFGRTVDQMADTVSAVFGRIPPGTPVPVIPLRRWATLRELVPLVTAFRLRLRIAHRRLPSYLDTAADRCAALRARARTAPTPDALLRLWRTELWPYCLETFDMMSAAARGRGGGNRLVKVRQRLAEQVGEADANALTTGIAHGAPLASLGPLLGLASVANGDTSPEDHIRQWGHRCPDEFEISLPRPAEDPTWLDHQLAAFRDSRTDVHAMLTQRRAEHEQAWARYQRKHPRHVTWTRRELRSWARLVHDREATRSEVNRAFWAIREVVLRAGELTGHGHDLFLLDRHEIERVLAGDDRPLAAVPARRDAYERYRALPNYPTLIRGPFDPERWAADPRRRTDLYDAATAPAPPEHPEPANHHSRTAGAPRPAATTPEPERKPPNPITGFPGAVGTVEGVARVVTSVDDAQDLRAGEVLVTTATNVGWTPLFPRAAAVVTDVGAPLSHAAIVARELGIPAVVGCGNATMRIRTGDRLRVHGERGEVHLIDPPTEGGAPPTGA